MRQKFAYSQGRKVGPLRKNQEKKFLTIDLYLTFIQLFISNALFKPSFVDRNSTFHISESSRRDSSTFPARQCTHLDLPQRNC